MSVNYMVFYKGCAENPQSFIDRYLEIHVPILKRFPGIQRLFVHTPLEWKDKHPVDAAGFSLVVQMQFASAEQLEIALRSSAREEARKDFEKFPPFNGEIWHQAVNTEEQSE